MFEIDYILIPVDFSRSSRAALSLARSLGGEHTQREVVHVVERWPAYMERVLFPYAPLGEDAPEIEHELVESAREAVTAFHELENDDDAVVIAFGPAKSTLVDHAAGTAANLIVMGAFGEGGARPDALGSMAERMIRSGRTTVLVREFESRPQIRKVLVAVDLTEGSQRLLSSAVGLAQAAEAELEIIHVIPDPLVADHSQVLAQTIKFDRRSTLGKSRDRIEALFDRLVRAIEPGFAEERQVASLIKRRKIALGDPASEISAYATEISADLVVVGSRNPAQPSSAELGRVACTVARRCPTHVAVVPLGSVSRLDEDG